MPPVSELSDMVSVWRVHISVSVSPAGKIKLRQIENCSHYIFSNLYPIIIGIIQGKKVFRK